MLKSGIDVKIACIETHEILAGLPVIPRHKLFNQA